MAKFNPRSILLIPLTLSFLSVGRMGFGFDENNRFRPNSLPFKVSAARFSLPLGPDRILVILPASMKQEIPGLQSAVKAASGYEMDFRTAEEAGGEDLAARHLIIAGNLQNNRWARLLYLKRQAFADAYFPGPGGIVITPAKSSWNPGKNVMVVGFSRDEDGPAAMSRFISLIKPGMRALGPVRSLKTPLAFPTPPESVAATLAPFTKDLVSFPPYRQVAFWGLAYHLSGDRRWAEYFMAGCRALYERAQRSGSWVPEPWTTLYFELFRFFLVWEMIDRDPAFGAQDRAVVEELLWNYTRVLDGDNNFPHFRPEIFAPDDIRQNHTTFLALDLFCACRYYREKYGRMDMESLRMKFETAFAPQLKALRSNDDAGFGYWTNLVFGYMYLAPNHALLYQTLQGNGDYLREKHLWKFADLLVTLTDNRRDGASFGDVSGYSHRAPGLPRGMTEKYLEIAAEAACDGQFQWVYDWLAHDSGFELNNFFDGEYAVDIPAREPLRFTGIHPVLLDDAALRWSARRSAKAAWRPVEGLDYFDKISFRRNFEADDEYLLLDGTSTFAHGHQDGNTVVRLTWKDRIWLFDMDYILHTPRFHNGLAITRDGAQDEPPPLTVLKAAADFPDAGFTRTVSEDFSGADWTRNIVWRKGRYFVFLDAVEAREKGDYRLDCRWRTRGEVEFKGSDLTVRQGGKEFRIHAADDALRFLTAEKESYWNAWDYPWGDKEIKILNARKKISMGAGSGWIFAHLMYASDGSPSVPLGFSRLGPSAFLIRSGSGAEITGLDPAFLAEAGIRTDARLFLLDSGSLRLVDATFVNAGDMSIRNPRRFHLEIDLKKSAVRLVVPPKNGGGFTLTGCRPEGANPAAHPAELTVMLNAGEHPLSLDIPLARAAGMLARLSGESSPLEAGLSPAGRTVNFGLASGPEAALEDAPTAFSPDGGSLLLGDRHGRISRFKDGKLTVVGRSPAEKSIGAIHAADIDGNGISEILASDTAENLFALTSEGRPLWTAKLTKYMGQDANAVDIAVGQPVAGRPLIFVATNGFKLLAFDNRGRLQWENLVRYHPQTRVRYVDDGAASYAAVGTVYSTPVNVFDALTGKLRWLTWDQVGDEMNSDTDYCGVHLTDMLFLDADGDGSRDIVFGTKYNRVYALRLKDGSTIWQANVGDEVRVLRHFVDPASGEDRIAVGTEAGDLVLLDRRGGRTKRVELESAVAGMEILAYPGRKRVDIALATSSGGIHVFTDSLELVASYSLGGEITGFVSPETGRAPGTFFVVSGRAVCEMEYVPYFLRKSRFY